MYIYNYVGSVPLPLTVRFHKVSSLPSSGHGIEAIYTFIPGTRVTPVLEGQLSKIWPFPIKTGVKRVLGTVYILYI